MRIGSNPQIEKPLQSSEYFHQVIMPVYIPNNEGYFKDSFNVLKISIDSLLKTVHPKTFISIVNNGSSPEIIAYLDDLYQNNTIHELIHTNNIGKVNAINKAFVGQSFPLVTITDADVLFLNNWQKAVYDICDAFPKAGAVCTTPNSRALKQLTENIFFDCFFSKSLRFTNVKDSQAMLDFVDSIGNPWELRPIHKQKCLTVNHKETSAMVGAGHYVCTYNRHALPEEGFGKTTDLMGKKLMYNVDVAVVKKGYWRLSTVDNFTYHMGNSSEEWMYEKLQNTIQEKNEIELPRLKKLKSAPLLNRFKITIFGALLFSRHLFWKNFLRYKGLKKGEAKYY